MIIGQFLVASDQNNELRVEQFDLRFSCWENDARAIQYCESRGFKFLGVFQTFDDRKPLYKYLDSNLTEAEKHLFCDGMVLVTQGEAALREDRQQRIQSAIVLGLEN
jgi:hypothetical protein